MEQTSPTTTTDWPPRRVALATLAVLGVAAAFFILFQFRLVFFSLFTAVVLSTAFKPLVNRLGRWGVSRPVSIILISLLVLGAVILLIMAIAPLLIEQGATMTALVSGWYANLRETLLESSSLLVRRIARQLPVILPTSLPAPDLEGAVSENSLDLVQRAVTITTAVLRSVLVTLAVLLLTSFWILEGERAQRLLLMIFNPERREKVRTFMEEIEAKVGAYTRGLAVLSLIIGAMATVAYLIIGLPNVLLLGILAGIMEAVPLVGPLLGAIPALLVAASVDPSKIVWVLVATAIFQTLENNLIVPRVMDRAVGVNPVASLLAFIAFGSIFGFVGALLAIPLAAVIQIALHRFVFSASTNELPAPVRRDAVSALRYEAQDLMQDVRKQVRQKEGELDKDVDQFEDTMETLVLDLDSILAQAETTAQEKDRRRSRGGRS